LVLSGELAETAKELQDAHTEEHPVVALAQKVAEEKLPGKSAIAYEGTLDERLCIREVFLELPDDIRKVGLNKLVQKDIITALDSDDRWKRMRGKQRTKSYGRVACWVPVREREGENG
jgi:hypothetical protein